MKSFLKYTLATITGIIISSILLFFITAGIIGALVSSTDKAETINSGTVLYLKFQAEIPERTSENFLDGFDMKHLRPSTKLGLNDILKNIRQAKTDPNIKGIFLDLNTIPAGWGTVEEIREALLDFKKSRKFVISYSDLYTQKAYYLASMADSVFLNPQGELLFLGLRAEILFYKGAFEKLDIEPQIFRHGKFKSFVEPYTSDKMSNENREQLSSLLNGIWGHVLTEISNNRKISVSKLNQYANELSIRNAESALSYKMVDGLRYRDEIRALLVKLSGAKSEKKLEIATLEKYNKVAKAETLAGNKIAVIYASGEINFGEGDDESIGSSDMSKTIREARQDTSIKAIVLRINSPGGSSLASDIIWREIYLASKAKPLIVSMGATAASGGYYIATPAQTIVADATTITGSIGVFGMFFNTKNFINKKLGITSDVAKTNDFADAGSIFRPVTPEEREVLQGEIEHIYDVFLTRVSDGRKLTKAAADSVGQGRVWCAIDAVKLGLVDTIGGLKLSIDIAAKKAKLTSYQLEELPKQKDLLSSLFSEINTKMKTQSLKSEFGDEYLIYSQIKKTLESQGVQTRIPYGLSIY